MRFLGLLLAVLTIVGCSQVPPLPTFDRFSPAWTPEGVSPERLVSVQRREIESYRFFHDLNEPRDLGSLVKTIEVYRLWYLPDTGAERDTRRNHIVRVVHWEDGRWSIAVRSMTHAEWYNGCVVSPLVSDPQRCPRPKFVLNYERLLTQPEIDGLRERLNRFAPWNTTQEALDEELCAVCVMHGTLWQLDAYRAEVEREGEDGETMYEDEREVTFWITSPPASPYYDLGKYFLELADLESSVAPFPRPGN